MTDWLFTPWHSIEHNSLEEALSEIADATTGEGETWWHTNDLVAAALQQFGRTRAIKRAIATSLGVGKSARAVEIRAEIARKFPPVHRYPDVRPALYTECRFWPDPVEALEAALKEGWSAADTRRARLAESGEKAGKLLFRRRGATMLVNEAETDFGETVTDYTVLWTEEGSSPFADDLHEVFVSIRERVLANDCSPAQPCGHPRSAIIQAGEGTAYCGECERLGSPREEIPCSK